MVQGSRLSSALSNGIFYEISKKDYLSLFNKGEARAPEVINSLDSKKMILQKQRELPVPFVMMNECLKLLKID